MKQKVAILLCLAFAGIVTGVVAWSRMSRATPESDPQQYWEDAGQRAYARFSAVSITDVGATESALANAPVEDAEALLARDPALLGSLREVALAFLQARFGAAGSSEYVASMEALGYRFKTIAEFERRYGPLAEWAADFGSSSSELRAVFEAAWNYTPSKRGCPDAVCTDRDSMVITIGRSNRNHFITQRPAGDLGYDLWHGGSGANCRFWMRAPVTREQIIATDGFAVAAQVAMIVGVPHSARRPLILSMFLDPVTSLWWIDGVSVTNYIGTDESSTCAEY